MNPNLKLARLVGSYHAHRGACNEREFLQWWDDLTHAQREQVMWYQRDGVAIFDYIREYHQAPITAAEAVQSLGTAFRRFAEELAASLTPIFPLLTKVNDRIKLYDYLSDVNLFGYQIIPKSWCDWLSAYWPLWLMPWRLGRKVKAIAIRLLEIKSPSLE